MEINNEFYGFIYKTTCLINKKIYIGQHKINKNINVSKRYLGSGVLLDKAFKKHGKENFEKEILKHCETQEKLDRFEKIFIKKFNSTNTDIGYNILPGNLLTFSEISEENKVKINKQISVKMKKYWEDHPERKLELSKRRKGKKASKETRKRQSNSGKGRKKSVEHKEKISKANTGCGHWAYGATFTEEHKENLSKGIKGKMVGENHPHWGKNISQDHKDAVSKAAKERWEKFRKEKQNKNDGTRSD